MDKTKKTMTIPTENVGRMRKLIADMRTHASGSAEEAWYTPDRWRELCNDLEACLPEEPKTSEDAMCGLGGLIRAGFGPALANYRGGSPNITVYVTCNGK